MKRPIIITVALLVYLGVMAFIGWPPEKTTSGYLQYFGTIGVTLIIIAVLFVFLRKREVLRQEKRKRADASDRRCYRDDHIL